VAEPRTRGELLAELNRIQRASRAKAVAGHPDLRTLADVLERFRALLTILEEYELEQHRQAGEAEALRTSLGFAQRAYQQAAAKLKPQPAPAEDERWPP
jgi:hypothetical protein